MFKKLYILIEDKNFIKIKIIKYTNLKVENL